MNGAPSTLVSPGLWGFAAFFVLSIALYLLMRNMNARMRRMSYRSEELQRDAEADTGRAGGRQETVENGTAHGDDASGAEEQTGPTP